MTVDQVVVSTAAVIVLISAEAVVVAVSAVVEIVSAVAVVLLATALILKVAVVMAAEVAVVLVVAVMDRLKAAPPNGTVIAQRALISLLVAIVHNGLSLRDVLTFQETGLTDPTDQCEVFLMTEEPRPLNDGLLAGALTMAQLRWRVQAVVVTTVHAAAVTKAIQINFIKNSSAI
jgi:hypothetical protein